jgi:hypothetical protein
VSITESLSHGATDLGRFLRTDPDDRVGAGDVRKLELIDAALRILGPFGGGVIKGRHVFGSTDLLKFAVFVPDGQLAELLLSLLLVEGMLRDGGIPLPYETGLPEDGLDGIHLLL